MKIPIITKNIIYKNFNNILNRNPSKEELIEFYKIYIRKREKGIIKSLPIQKE